MRCLKMVAREAGSFDSLEPRHLIAAVVPLRRGGHLIAAVVPLRRGAARSWIQAGPPVVMAKGDRVEKISTRPPLQVIE